MINSINLNEHQVEINEGLTLHQLREYFKPRADVVILNGLYPVGDVETEARPARV